MPEFEAGPPGQPRKEQPPGVSPEAERAVYERERRRVERTVEVISHPGADVLAVRRSARILLGWLEEGTERFNPYVVQDLDRGLVERLASLEERGEKGELKQELERLRKEIKAREALQGAYADWNYVRDDLKTLAETLFTAGWKTVPKASDFRILFNLSATPFRTKEEIGDIAEEPVVEERWDEETQQWVVVKKTRKRRRGVVSLKGEIKEGEEPLGLKIDKGLRLYVALAIAKTPKSAENDEEFLEFLQRKFFRDKSLEEVAEEREKAKRILGLSAEELENLVPLSDTAVTEEIASTREWIRNKVGREAEEIAYKLFYIWELATQFNFEVDGEYSDDSVKLAQVNEKRQKEWGEGEKCQTAGPPASIGSKREDIRYYPDLMVDFLQFVKSPEEDKNFWELWWEEGKTLGELPWEKLREGVYNGFMYARFRSFQVYQALMKMDWKIGELQSQRTFIGLNKPFNTLENMLGHVIKKQEMRMMRINFCIAALLMYVDIADTKGEGNPPIVFSGDQWRFCGNEPRWFKGAMTRSGFLTEEEWAKVEEGVKKRQCIPLH